MDGIKISVVTSRSLHIRILDILKAVENVVGMRSANLLDKLKMKDLVWERRQIISRVWLRWCLFGRRMSVILLVKRRDVRRKLWRMGVDNGDVRDVINLGINHIIGITTLYGTDDRYIMTISVNDHTAQAWFNLFDDVGHKVLGVDANTLVEYKETDISKANDVFNAANFSTWTWRVRGKQDNFQGQVRVRYQVLDAFPVDYKKESERLVKLIQSY
jgi:hypothetical protein